jgi:uncharacterized protein DUF262
MAVVQQQLADLAVEEIPSESADLNSSPIAYEVLTYPADFTLASHVDKLARDEIQITGFQRKYVWKQPQASKLIESFLLGLPVPPVFFYLEPDTNKMIVVDGQQRLRSIAYFYKGVFGESSNGKVTVFSLSGLADDSPYADKTYEDLDDKAKLKLDNAVLRSFVIRQLKPDDNSSIYHIFERLNTGGTLLQGQEIRNCVYHGAFNELMKDELNRLPAWREIVGIREPDKRSRDVELILRFFALYYSAARYEKPMKKFLNDFMDAERNADRNRLDEFRALFTETAARVLSTLGKKPFHIQRGINVAAFDAVFTAFAKHRRRRTPSAIKTKYRRLIKSTRFLACITAATTDKDVVKKRLKLASGLFS